MWNLKRSKPEWIFGGVNGEFEISDPFKFALVHTPMWIESESRLVLFGNGHYIPPIPQKPRARILDFTLDVAKKKVVSSKVTSVGAGASEHSGGISIDGSVVTVGFGSHAEGKWDVQELRDGTPTMSIRFQDHGYNYRVYRAKPKP